MDISSTFVCVVASDDVDIKGDSVCEPDRLRKGFDIERRLFKLGDPRVLASLILWLPIWIKIIVQHWI